MDNLEDLNLLIVDDSPNICTALKSNLRNLGFQGKIYTAHSVPEAQKKINELYKEAVIFDMILSDWNMPELTGLDFLKWVRAHNFYSEIPFIMITTENEKLKVLDAINEGANDYIIKPWDTSKLKDKIIKCISS